MSPEHDQNASPSANEVNETAGENPTSTALEAATPVVQSETHSSVGATGSASGSSSGTGTAVVRAPEVVAAAPAPKPEPPAETRTERTEQEAHQENVHPSNPPKEDQKPTHAPAHKAEASADAPAEPVVEGDPAFAGMGKAARVAASAGRDGDFKRERDECACGRRGNDSSGGRAPQSDGRKSRR